MSASAYASLQARIESPREIEIRAFRYVNGLLARASGRAERLAALHKTHRLWSLLLEDLLSPGNRLPADLKGRLVSLALWAQREALARMGDEASLEPLLALHRDMIEGLEAQGQAATAPYAGPRSA